MPIETKALKGTYSATVVSNKPIRKPFYKLRLEFEGDAAAAFINFQPGRFIQLDVSVIALPAADKIPLELADACQRQVLLRRPFSFFDVTGHGDRIAAELLYCVVGPATLRMTTLAAGDTVSIVGPLGNGFWVPQNKKIALLVIGGMGVPPLQHLAKLLTAKYSDTEVFVFAGAKSADSLPFEKPLDEISQELGFVIPEFARLGITSVIATDDGSKGYHGFVTDCLEQWLKENSGKNSRDIIIYSCGPEPMLAKVAEIAKKKNIDCQVSMERRMACGIGLCQSCVIEFRTDNPSQTIYKLCCEDGPVFDARDVIFKV
jgi:dihydroorotate dehydrogenase electron transfer subunit